MVCTVHLVPVGHTRETLIGSLRSYPVDKVILVLGKNEALEGEKIARRIASELKKDLGTIPWSEMFLDLDDISGSALELVARIRAEQALGCLVRINLSGSLRSVGIAAYMAALVTGAPAYLGLPEYKGGSIVGLRSLVEVPTIPLKDLSKEKEEILLALLGKGDLLLPGLMKDKSESERSRLSYHLKDLKKDGFVDTIKQGRNLKVSLTFAGRLYAAGL